jgi:RHS repeat-associated protein
LNPNWYTYDLNGNMTKRRGADLTYDSENRLIELNDGPARASFVYGHDGERVKKIDSSYATTLYIGDIYERTDDGSATRHILSGGQKIAWRDASGVHYYHGDHLGSLDRASKGSDGSVEQVERYYPFGQSRGHSGPGNHAYRFTGKELEASGLYYYGARYYDPVIGRFISADSIVPKPGDPQSLNRYSYARNNPLYYVDPSGHFFLEFFMVLIGAFFGSSMAAATGGDPLFGAAIGVASAGIFAGVESAVASSLAGVVESATLSGAIAGGAGGAAAGAFSGGVNAAYYGGDIGEGMLMGAGIGAGTGAAFGAIRGYLGSKGRVEVQGDTHEYDYGKIAAEPDRGPKITLDSYSRSKQWMRLGTVYEGEVRSFFTPDGELLLEPGTQTAGWDSFRYKVHYEPVGKDGSMIGSIFNTSPVPKTLGNIYVAHPNTWASSSHYLYAGPNPNGYIWSIAIPAQESTVDWHVLNYLNVLGRPGL